MAEVDLVDPLAGRIGKVMQICQLARICHPIQTPRWVGLEELTYPFPSGERNGIQMIGFVALALIIMLDLGVAPESLVDSNRRRKDF